MPLIASAANGGLAAALTQHVIHRLSLTQGVNPAEQRPTRPGFDRHPDPQCAPHTISNAVLVRIADPVADATQSRRYRGLTCIFACPRSDVGHADAAREVLMGPWTLMTSSGAIRQRSAGGIQELAPMHVSPFRRAVKAPLRLWQGGGGMWSCHVMPAGEGVWCGRLRGNHGKGPQADRHGVCSVAEEGRHEDGRGVGAHESETHAAEPPLRVGDLVRRGDVRGVLPDLVERDHAAGSLDG